MRTWVKLDCTNGILRLLSNEMLKAFSMIVLAFEDDDIHITSLTEGIHKAGSRHYSGNAIDVLPPLHDKERKLAKLIATVGKNYDIVNEVNHWHIEYDPK